MASLTGQATTVLSKNPPIKVLIRLIKKKKINVDEKK